MVNHPWGLSGPEFLWLYGICLVLALAWAVHRRGGVRRPALVEPVRVPNEHALAYLAAGPNRVVETSLARLVDAGAARVSRSGVIVPTRATVDDPFDRRVQSKISKNQPQGVGPAISKAVALDEITELRDRLVRQRLLLSPETERAARRAATIGFYPLLLIGLVRLVNGVAQDLPVGYLALFLVVTAGILVLLHNMHIRTRTVHGDAVLTAATDDRSTGRVELAGIGAVVALGGFVAYPDEDVRDALLLTANTSGGAPVGGASSSCGSSSSASSGSSCGGGGSSCGGGGCGGGSS